MAIRAPDGANKSLTVVLLKKKGKTMLHYLDQLSKALKRKTMFAKCGKAKQLEQFASFASGRRQGSK